MNGRAVRISLVRKHMWAVLAALLPATPCFGGETADGPEAGDAASAIARIERAYAGRSDDAPPVSAPEPLPAAPPRRRRASAPLATDQLPELPPSFRGARPSAPPRAAAARTDPRVRMAAAEVVPGTFPAPTTPSPTPPAMRLASADLPPETFPAPPPPAPGGVGVVDDAVGQAGCATCGGFHNSAEAPTFHASFGCAGGSCVPGQKPCYPPATPCDTVFGRFFSNLYQCLCCPDPCYQPKWVPAANASLFADYARPRTVTRIRYDNLNNMLRPDRNEFFLKQTGPNKRPFPIRGVLYQNDPSARLQQVSLYQEAAGERGSFFIEIPYRQLNPLYSPTQAGFSDINFGVKSLLYDCEMLQVSFQFRTYTPSGNATAGLGTGHVSLDPSILTSLKLSPTTYLQGQYGNWTPLGGTNHIAGGVFYWLTSLNQELFRTSPDSPVIGTLELDGYSFENGGYTRPLAIPNAPTVHGVSTQIRNQGGGASYFNIGPGLRWSICNKVDIGTAVTFSTTGLHWADPWYRLEVRFLF